MLLEPIPPSEQLDTEQSVMADSPNNDRSRNLFFKIEKVKSFSPQFPVSSDAKLSKSLQIPQIS